MTVLNRSTQRGFSLTEVIVTLIVMSAGLLGAASMQLSAMGNSRASFERNYATLLANEMVERVRSNIPGASAGHYNIALQYVPLGTAGACNGASADCSAADLAATDLADWFRRMNVLTEDASAQINVSVDGAGVATSVNVTVSWGDSQVGLVAELP